MGTILLRILSANGFAEATPLLSFPDAGTSGAAHVCYAVAATLFPRRMAFFLYGLILGVTIILLFSQQLSAAVTHLGAVLAGGAFGWFSLRPRLYGEETANTAEEQERETVLQ